MMTLSCHHYFVKFGAWLGSLKIHDLIYSKVLARSLLKYW